MEEVLGMFQGVDKIYKDVRIISILCRSDGDTKL